MKLKTGTETDYQKYKATMRQVEEEIVKLKRDHGDIWRVKLPDLALDIARQLDALKAKLAITAYLVGCIVTFGHAANNPKLPECGMAPLICVVWPLYWSWVAFQPKESKLPTL